MAKEIENGIYTLSKDEGGIVTLSENVVSVIAAYAATDVEGVMSMASGIKANLLSKVGIATLSKGIRVVIADDKISIDAAVTVKYGHSIPKISQLVQRKIKDSVENMTGLEVTAVNIRVAGIALEGEEND